MRYLPKKTYSRRDKINKALISKRDTEVHVGEGDIDVDRTLPDDIWKDSFDRLKELESVPTPKKRNSDKVFNQNKEFLIECDKSLHSFVSTPKVASEELLVCPLPYSPIATRRYFLSNEFYDSRGNPRRVFEYSSEISQGLLQSLEPLKGTEQLHRHDKTKSENFLMHRKKQRQNLRIKAAKLCDNTNLSICKNKRNKAKRKPKYKTQLTGKENAEPTKTDEKRECDSVQNVQISPEIYQNPSQHSTLRREFSEKNQNSVKSSSFQNSKEKCPQKRQKPQSCSLDNLSEVPAKDIGEIDNKRNKPTTSLEVNFTTAGPEQSAKDSLGINKVSLKAVSCQKSKLRRRNNRQKPTSGPLENLSEPPGIDTLDIDKERCAPTLEDDVTTTSVPLSSKQSTNNFLESKQTRIEAASRQHSKLRHRNNRQKPTSGPLDNLSKPLGIDAPEIVDLTTTVTPLSSEQSANILEVKQASLKTASCQKPMSGGPLDYLSEPPGTDTGEIGNKRSKPTISLEVDLTTTSEPLSSEQSTNIFLKSKQTRIEAASCQQSKLRRRNNRQKPTSGLLENLPEPPGIDTPEIDNKRSTPTQEVNLTTIVEPLSSEQSADDILELNQTNLKAPSSKKLKLKRANKDQKSMSGPLHELSGIDTLEAISLEVELASNTEPLYSQQSTKEHFELNQTKFNYVSSRKSKQKDQNPKGDSIENFAKLPDNSATCSRSHAKRSKQTVLQVADMATEVEVLNSEELALQTTNTSNRMCEKVRGAIVISDDCSRISPSQNTSFKTNPDIKSTKKARTKRQTPRRANRYLPLPFVQITRGKKLEQPVVIEDDSLPTIVQDLGENLNEKITGDKIKSKVEKCKEIIENHPELYEEKNKKSSLTHRKEPEIAFPRTRSQGNIAKGYSVDYKSRKTSLRDEPKSNGSADVIPTQINDNLDDRLSFVNRRTRGRQSHRKERNDQVFEDAGSILIVENNNSCSNIEIETVQEHSLCSSDTEPKTARLQSKKNKVKWETSPTLSAVTDNSCRPTNISLDSSIDVNEFLSAINRTTMLDVRSKTKNPSEPKLSIVLQPGKWRKSLNMWRRHNSFYKDKINDSEIIPAPHNLFSNQSLMRTFSDEPFRSSFARATDRRTSTRLGNNSSCIYKRKSIVDYRNSAHLLREGEDIYDVKETIPEVECDISSNGCSESALLLEPTDDESPNLSTCSNLTSISKQNVCTSLRRSQTVCYKDLCSPGDTQYSNEVSNERTQRYQHQLSVPLPFCRQPSISRRRRTSIVGIPLPGIGGPLCEDDLFTEFVSLSTYEVSLCALLDARDTVLRRCGQSEPLSFADEYSEKALHQCRKIGEGVYGEVFMNKSFSGETVVLKIIPIEGCIEINGEAQKRFDEILSEIVIAMELSRLRNDKEYTTSGFVEVKKVRCVKGRYPDYLVELWELYRENHGTENDHPEVFPEDQLYIILELANGGQDLEAYTFQNALQSYSAFVQVALTIAAAECKFQFEHRDLHWGNILLAPTEEKDLSFRVAGKEINIPTHGVKATIIDYTLSRMVFDGFRHYYDLSNDNELFSATGDYQYDIYRFMRKRLEDQWERFEPYTNVLWLHYAIDKMISGARYRCSKSKKHRAAIQDMMQLRDEMLDYKSASDYIDCLN